MRMSVTLLATLVLAGCGPSQTSNVDTACFNRTSAQLGGPFTLTSHTGETLTQEDFLGRKTLVFFGFTYCPDFCPDALYRAGRAISKLPEGVEAPLTAFISVDPERDTPELLSRYIASNGFPEDMVGMTGTPEQLQAVSSEFGAYFERVDDDTTASGYQMAHSLFLYLMDEDWNLATFFGPDTTIDEMAACIAALD